MRTFCLAIFFHFLTFTVLAQNFEKALDYVIKTPFVESDGRVVSVQYGEDIYLLGKIRGGNSQTSEYAIERYNKDLDLVWSVRKQFTEDDQLKGIKVLNDKLVLFWVTHNIKKRES